MLWGILDHGAGTASTLFAVEPLKSVPRRWTSILLDARTRARCSGNGSDREGRRGAAHARQAELRRLRAQADAKRLEAQAGPFSPDS